MDLTYCTNNNIIDYDEENETFWMKLNRFQSGTSKKQILNKSEDNNYESLSQFQSPVELHKNAMSVQEIITTKNDNDEPCPELQSVSSKVSLFESLITPGFRKSPFTQRKRTTVNADKTEERPILFLSNDKIPATNNKYPIIISKTVDEIPKKSPILTPKNINPEITKAPPDSKQLTLKPTSKQLPHNFTNADPNLENLMIQRIPGETVGMEVTWQGIGPEGSSGGSWIVKSVQPKGPADRASGGASGIAVGDQLVAINGRSVLSQGGSDFIQSFLKYLPLKAEITIKRGFYAKRRSPPGAQFVTPTPSPRRLKEDTGGWEVFQPKPAVSPVVVINEAVLSSKQLPKTDNADIFKSSGYVKINLEIPVTKDNYLGLEIRRGTDQFHQFYQITRVHPEGAYGTPGFLKVGDYLHGINGQSVVNIPHSDLLHVLHTSKNIVSVIIWRDSKESWSTDELPSVKISKPDNPILEGSLQKQPIKKDEHESQKQTRTGQLQSSSSSDVVDLDDQIRQQDAEDALWNMWGSSLSDDTDILSSDEEGKEATEASWTLPNTPKSGTSLTRRIPLSKRPEIQGESINPPLSMSQSASNEDNESSRSTCNSLDPYPKNEIMTTKLPTTDIDNLCVDLEMVELPRPSSKNSDSDKSFSEDSQIDKTIEVSLPQKSPQNCLSKSVSITGSEQNNLPPLTILTNSEEIPSISPSKRQFKISFDREINLSILHCDPPNSAPNTPPLLSPRMLLEATKNMVIERSETYKGIFGLGVKCAVVDNYPIITEIQSRGSLSKCKKLCVGDILLSINDKQLLGLSETNVNHILRVIPRGLVTITFCKPTEENRRKFRLGLQKRPRQPPDGMEYSDTTSNQSPFDSCKLFSSFDDQQYDKASTTLTVTDGSDQSRSSIVMCRTPAVQKKVNKIAVNDFVKKVAKSPQSKFPPDEQILDVHVEKTTVTGFFIEGGKGSLEGDMPIKIKRMYQGTSGEKMGLVLRPGDEILEVNGVSFSDFAHHEAFAYLRSLPQGPLYLQIRRFTKPK